MKMFWMLTEVVSVLGCTLFGVFAFIAATSCDADSDSFWIRIAASAALFSVAGTTVNQWQIEKRNDDD